MPWFLISHSLKVLGIGDMEHTDQGEFVSFRRRNVDSKILATAILSFVAKFGVEGIRLCHENEFWNLDLSKHERVDEDFGIPFRGGRSFIEPPALRPSTLSN